MKKLLPLALLALSIACGDDSEPTNNSSNTNNGETNNSESNNSNINNETTGQTTSSNNTTTGQTNQTVSPGIDEPYIANFRWIRRDNSGCDFTGCDAGFEMITVARSISNFDGRVALINDEDDWASWESVALTPEVLNKIVDGWECPEAVPEAQYSYQLEVRIQDNGIQLHRPDVTGCFEAEEADLMQINAELERLSDKYLP